MSWGNLTTAAAAMSAASLFVRWRFPAVPPSFASAGAGASLALAALSFLQPDTLLAISLVLNAGALVGILEYRFLSHEIPPPSLQVAEIVLNFTGKSAPTEVSNSGIYSWYATSLLLTAMSESGDKHRHIFNQWAIAIWFVGDMPGYQVIVESLSGEHLVSTVSWQIERGLFLNLEAPASPTVVRVRAMVRSR